MKKQFFNAATQLVATAETFADGETVVEVYDLIAPVAVTTSSVPGIDEFALVREVTFPAGLVDTAIHYARTIVLDRSLKTTDDL